ncbi:aminoacyl-tRNA hydrolase [Streptomyces orinoci]|uniref:Peptidyl-tRNA hydrolase n=1 Tax=Streptomyces orinoci TaxID=67339 RepID=A0ABV3K665_STRON|nr:aminoacyl-tRNA hydrolase [Streptomyces orinoci]
MTSEERWVIAGLGNPGPWFTKTRHNAGFLVIDRLARRHGAEFRWYGTKCRLAEIDIDGRRVILVKPQWFINLSGNPVASVLRTYDVPVERLAVVHDDLAFRFGAVRIKRGGGAGGHNGVRSVTEALGTRHYTRLRFGLGRPPKGQQTGKYVLRKFPEPERSALPAVLDRCADAIEALVVRGLDKTQTELHSAPGAGEE